MDMLYCAVIWGYKLFQKPLKFNLFSKKGTVHQQTLNRPYNAGGISPGNVMQTYTPHMLPSRPNLRLYRSVSAPHPRKPDESARSFIYTTSIFIYIYSWLKTYFIGLHFPNILFVDYDSKLRCLQMACRCLNQWYRGKLWDYCVTTYRHQWVRVNHPT